MNLIYICVFHQESYINLLKLLLTSISVKANINKETTDILIITSPEFQPRIQKEVESFDFKLCYYILDLHTLFEAGCSRQNIFKYENIDKYDTILYIDTDILLNSDVNVLFELDLSPNKIYALEEESINHPFWGSQFFDFEKHKRETTAFTSGILLFKNSDCMKSLFDTIQLHITDYIYTQHHAIPDCLDQPFIVYHAISQNKYDNQLLKKYVENNPSTVSLEKIIYHFPGGPGAYDSKISKMNVFWTKMNDFWTKIDSFMIDEILRNQLTLVSKDRLENVFKQCRKYRNKGYSFVECGVAKGGCLALMKYASGNDKIFGFDSFEGMPDITVEDIDTYNKSCPLTSFGKVGDNLSGGIENVYETFKILNLDRSNVTLVKGFFQDTLQVQENIDLLGEIAVLRLDGDWYNSVNICLEKLYDKVIDGGVIIIDDYGHFIGAKRATDEFREKRNIVSPFIQTDYTEFYWIKNDTTIRPIDIKSLKTVNIHEDIWTCSDEMRIHIADFFKDKSHFKIAEIGAHKGYTTKVLSYLFSKVYAVDNSVEWTEFNKNYNNNRTNIEYVMLDIYNDDWNILPSNIEVAFIDAGHSYDACKSDIIHSINQFTNLKYIIFDDYGVWEGVKRVIDEMLGNHTLIFERFIGLTNIPGPSGVVNNTNEGIICSVNMNKVYHILDNKKYSWQNESIKFLTNGLMNAFGNGTYTQLNAYTIQANFGGRIHALVFNDDYTEFTSTREGDGEIVKGQLI